jgi:hypothetical protein
MGWECIADVSSPFAVLGANRWANRRWQIANSRLASDNVKHATSQTLHVPSSEGRITHHAPHRILLPVVLLVASFLRVILLAEVPIGVDYDEAGNYILAQEIASGQSRPVFIRAYAGREAVFYWLAAGSMRLLGRNLFAFRLAAALCGVGTVLFCYLLAREMFRDAPDLERQWVPLLGAAIMAVSYWHVHVSRYGFRVNAMTLFIAATMFALWRGLRHGNWIELAIAGLLCGLSANTYLAIRAFPLVLLPFALWVILTWRPWEMTKVSSPLAPLGHSPPRGGIQSGGWRWLRLRQFALFGLAALVTFAPLGVFFLRNPEYFSVRMGQASTLDPEIHGGDLWGTLGRVTLKALGMFTVRGDDNPIYNIPGKPIFGPLWGAAFYLGLLACLWYAVRSPGHQACTPYFLILVWLPVMMIPNVLGARGVPHALRSMGTMPVVYYLPALGVVTGMRSAAWLWARLRSASAQAVLPQWLGASLVIATLLVGGVQTGQQYFSTWAHSAGAYYSGSAALRRAGEYLGEWNADQVALWVSNSTYRHTSYAVTCRNYAKLHWFNDRTLVLPLRSDWPVLYAFDFTNPLDPTLARYLPPDALQHRDLGPDGGIGFEAYLVPPERLPLPEPQFPAQVNLGHTLEYMGYDLNAPAVSGDALDVTLYWRVLRDGDRDDYAFFAHLVDDLGFRWGGETFFNVPSLQWRAGDVMIFRKEIEIAPGAPPGQYGLSIGAYSSSLDARLPVLNEAGQMAGTRIKVGPLDVARAAFPPAELPTMEQPVEVVFDESLSLLGTDRDRGDLQPGETLALTLYWQANTSLQDAHRVSIWLEGAQGRVPLWEGDPVHGLYPLTAWRPPEFVRDRYALRLPTDAPAGDYDLRLALLGSDGTVARTADGAAFVSLYTMHVKATDKRWELPAFAYPVGARLGDKVELLGYDLDRQQAAPGETIHLTLVWRCLDEMDTAYTVFTHLLDAGGQVRGQKDNPPVGGSYPTTLWVPDEVVVDEYTIQIQADAPPGAHVIEVGMYDPSNVRRLPVIDPSGTTGDRVLLGNVQVSHP